MLNCPYNNSCIKPSCDLSCGEFSEFEHWFNRCGLTITNPALRSSVQKINEADNLIKCAESDVNTDSSYIHLSIYSGPQAQQMADLTSYVAICKYCRNIGFYNGVYKLNFSQYIEEIKKSWNNRYNDEKLEDMKLWIRSSKYLIICNLGLVRFGDFESQTLLTLFQERYEQNKFTILVLEKGKFGLPGKADSLFYSKLKKEITSRGVRL